MKTRPDSFDREVTMETETMGRVTVKAKIENLSDLHLGASSTCSRPKQVRFVEVDDALVDTGATCSRCPRT